MIFAYSDIVLSKIYRWNGIVYVHFVKKIKYVFKHKILCVELKYTVLFVLFVLVLDIY